MRVNCLPISDSLADPVEVAPDVPALPSTMPRMATVLSISFCSWILSLSSLCQQNHRMMIWMKEQVSRLTWMIISSILRNRSSIRAIKMARLSKFFSWPRDLASRLASCRVTASPSCRSRSSCRSNLLVWSLVALTRVKMASRMSVCLQKVSLKVH